MKAILDSDVRAETVSRLIGMTAAAVCLLSALTFIVSVAGHPPFTNMGIAILPASLAVSVTCAWLAIRFARREQAPVKAIALWFYIAAFAALTVGSWAVPETRGSGVELVVDIVVSLATLVGLLAYATHVAVRELIAAWKVVAPLILLGSVLQLVLEWPRLATGDPELPAAEH